MQFFLYLLLLSAGVTTLSHRHPHALRKRGRELTRAVSGTAPSSGFAFDLYRVLASVKPSQNIVFSPLSISMSLAMLSLGARSHTKTEILKGLGLNLQKAQEDRLHRTFQQQLQELGHSSDSFQLSLGNALFTDTKVAIHNAFLRALKTRYLADVLPSNFQDKEAAKKQINDYVAKQTKNKIVDLVKGIDRATIMVMVNYIFFKAKWEKNFIPENTELKPFYVTAKKVVQVPMMSREDMYYYFLDQNLSCKVVGIPYQGNATALFILPDKGSMKRVENGLNEKTLQKWLKMLKKRRLQVYLPRFSIEDSHALKNDLPKLGIQEVFTFHADLSGITNHSNTRVSEIMHKAMVKVDEAGTEASAATEIAITFKSSRKNSPVLVFNRPFLMLIVNGRNNIILFFSKVIHPRDRASS